MSKNYPDQLGEWVRQRAKSRRDRNLVAFLAAAEDVRAALNAGFAAKTIWGNLYEAKRIPFCYDTFLSYVRRYLETKEKLYTQECAQAQQAQQPPAPQRGFVFNPVPNKEELL